MGQVVFRLFAFLAALVLAAGGAFMLLWVAGYHVVRAPTEDQLYGCTVEQQAPNGECR
jgi:hypothetical protein